MTFPERVAVELGCQRLDAGPTHSLEEAVGRLHARMWMFYDEAMRQPADRVRTTLLATLVAIAAAAQRVTEDLSLCPRA